MPSRFFPRIAGPVLAGCALLLCPLRLSASEPTVPAHAALDVPGYLECSLARPCPLPLAFYPLFPSSQGPEPYPLEKPVGIRAVIGRYRYDLLGAPENGLGGAQSGTLSPAQLQKEADRSVGTYDIVVSVAGDYDGELQVTNPDSGVVDKLPIAILTQGNRLFIGQSIPRIIAALDPSVRREVLTARQTLAAAQWHAKLPTVDRNRACTHNLHEPGFDIVRATTECQAAETQFHLLATIAPFSLPLLANYNAGHFEVSRKGRFKGDAHSWEERFGVLPYTPIHITARAPKGTDMILSVDDGRTERSNDTLLGTSSVITERLNLCTRPSGTPCATPPRPDGSLELDDIIADDHFELRVAQPIDAVHDGEFSVHIVETGDAPLR